MHVTLNISTGSVKRKHVLLIELELVHYHIYIFSNVEISQ